MPRTLRALSWLLPLMGGGAGCTGSTTCDPAVEECEEADTGVGYEGEIDLLQVDHGCCSPGEDRCPAGGAWWVDVVTDGAPPQVEFTLLQANLPSSLRWSETHAVPATLADPDGYWTDHYLEVEVTRTSDCSTLRDCADRFRTGVNTLFACEPDLEAAGLQLVVRVSDAEGEELACEDDGATSVDARGCDS